MENLGLGKPWMPSPDLIVDPVFVLSFDSKLQSYFDRRMIYAYAANANIK